MIQTSRVTHAIFKAIDELNEELPSEEKLNKSEATILYGQVGALDSLALVNLIVAAEEHIEEEFGVSIVLADERAMSQRNSPFRTVGALADYASMLLGENDHG